MSTDSRYFLAGVSLPVIDPELLSEIVSTAADISMLVSAEGIVTAVMANPHHPAFGKLDGWIGSHVSKVVNGESYEKFAKRVETLKSLESGSLAVELNHTDVGLLEFPVRYSMHRVGPARDILLMGRDMRPVAEMQQQLVAAQIALERDYETQRGMDTRYRVLLETTRDAMVLVALNSGRVVDLNEAAALALGGPRNELLGADIAQEFEGRRRGEFIDNLSSLASADAASPVDLVARRSRRKLRLVPKLFRAAGERLMMCRLEAPEHADAPETEISKSLEKLFNDGVDAMVLLDQDGVITASNDAFLKLIGGSRPANARGRSLAEFLARGSVDLRILLDNARRSGHLRLYATKVLGEFSNEVSVEISATYMGSQPKRGFGLIIRDSGHADIRRRPGLAGGEDSVRSVMELVGSSTLKDIVAETTDVVERMCIQTAVDLTRNNRVAAAEMLGLSRQSLYVKLRKFGLLSKDDD